jgi:dTDP-4-dehydrorhamnose 3,5-epimerase
MKFEPTRLPEVIAITPRVFGDHRGYFMETWHAAKFEAGGIAARFVQENQSSSSHGVLRGLHYQVLHPQGKLVRVVSGRVFDVAVDLRRSSPRFGQWVGVWLSGEDKNALWVPPGFGHGYYVASDSAVFTYLCTELYAPEHERGVRFDDPEIGIEWPVLAGTEPVLSQKDLANPLLRDAEVFT